MRLDWLAAELRAAGLTVIEHDGWKTRTMRPFDQFMPVGLLNHHTAGSSVLTNYPDPPYWSNRRLEASCNITIRGDGTVCVLNAGWAYDSGNGDKKVLAAVRADRSAPKPSDTYIDGRPGGTNPGISGGRYFIDIEVQHLGNGDAIAIAQRAALITTNAVICRHMRWDPRYRLIGHRGWTRRKVDPRWDGTADPMPQIRTDTLSTMEDEMLLPIEYGDDTEDVTLLEDLINQTYGERLPMWPRAYDDKTKVAVKARLGKYTNDPDGEEGKLVNGRMFTGLLKDFVKKQAVVSGTQGPKGDPGPTGPEGAAGPSGKLTISGDVALP